MNLFNPIFCELGVTSEEKFKYFELWCVQKDLTCGAGNKTFGYEIFRLQPSSRFQLIDY